ncbi:hypothetical protein ABW19_dt0202959 [Dactylella cylindrospora]|nr:hypothetical protein ABW19_dt0202959 [Dactylella cylindrospora]
MSTGKDGWHPADQRDQPPPSHLPPSQPQPGRQSPAGMHRYQPPSNQGPFYNQGPPAPQGPPPPQSQGPLPQLPGLSSGQPPYPLPSLQGNPQLPQPGPPQHPHPHMLDRPQHEPRPPHGQISPPVGLGQPPQAGHIYSSNPPPPLQQQSSGPPQERLGPIPPANAPQPHPNMSSHPLQPMSQLPPQPVAQPSQPHQEAVASIVNAPPAPALVNAPMAGSGAVPASYRPLNVKDALSYLDQVKVQFAEHPDVYNRFLDIMKDFKSQAIDTPGVIERVSTLFAGHPNLIQGFNTFLPPGYRIECSSDPSDPHSIRVTTPQGTTTATSGQPPVHHLQQGSMSGAGQPTTGWRGPDAWGEPNSQFRYEGDRAGPQGQPPRDIGAQGQGRPPHQIPNQPVHLQQPQPMQPGMGQHGASETVNQLQNAAAAANGTGPLQQAGLRQQPPPGPGIGQGIQGGPLTPGADVKRGPVEFNHAISYVNKIKTRFSSQPEIYKNFLEILQTYQRESKPIQEVYSQVTQLFNAAPDLLEDFKQFLPESAAQARQKVDDQGRDTNGMGARGPPPQGHFAPPLAAPKGDNKRKRPPNTAVPPPRDPGIPPMPPALPVNDITMTGTGPSPGARGANNKRPKINHPKAVPEPVSPTLIPANPEPLNPSVPLGATNDELMWFDRVRKYIGNKQTWTEFLKVLNMFSQDVMDKSHLLTSLEAFLGTNPELFNWMKKFLGISDKLEDNVLNAVKHSQKVRLAVCRALGPSYRLLPKQETTKPCSGRDAMCWAVLNDHWASHPTWASEDSGFVGHKKNQYEEMLHRIEEERHDYDLNIEANLRTIQLLEPIAQRIASMTPEEQAAYTLPPGLGGASRTIYQKVIKKIWREEGLEIIKELHEHPAACVHIVLKRLKQKDEEWRLCQREWNRIWREQTQKIFYKSLDHQGNNFKVNDKRVITNRHFITEIQTLYQSQKDRIEQSGGSDAKVKPYQLQYRFPDLDVVLDLTRLLASHLEKEGVFSYGDRVKISNFVKRFIPTFFGLSKEDVDRALGNVSHKSPDEDVEMDYADSSSGRSTKRKQDLNLLQDLLKRSRNGKSAKKEGSVYSSRGSTPEDSNEDDAMEDITMDGEPIPPNAPTTWMNPLGGSRESNGADILSSAAASDARDVRASELKERHTYSMFANSTIYCFIRLLQTVYQRLLDVKNSEVAARELLERRKVLKPSHKLGLAQNTLEDFFDVSEDTIYYHQVLDYCEKLIHGVIEAPAFEEGMRSVYISKGWQLYTVDKHIATLNKTIQTFVSDSRDHSGEILKLFERDRAEEKTNYQLQMSYRRDVEAFIGREEPTYRIEWNTVTKRIAIQLLFRVDPTHTAKLTKDEKWSYYIDSYIMAQPTEGVPAPQRPPFLVRSLPTQDIIDTFSSGDCELSGNYSFKKPIVEEGLELKICVNTYKMFFTPNTTDAMILSGEQRSKFISPEKRATLKRKQTFRNKFASNKRFKDAPDGTRVLGFEGLPGLWKP